jgi:hypothetical protein
MHVNKVYCEFLYPDLIWEHSSVFHARNIADSFTENSTLPVTTQPELSNLIFDNPYIILSRGGSEFGGYRINFI